MHDAMLEAVVENLLTAYGIDFTRGAAGGPGTAAAHPAFIARAHGVRTALDVKQASPDARRLYTLFAWYEDAGYRSAIDRLLLVTPKAPSDADRLRFTEMFDHAEGTQWIALAELPRLLGIPDEIDFASPQALDRLQTASLMRMAGRWTGRIDLEERDQDPGDTRSRLNTPRTGRPREMLRIGEGIRPYVLLSDLKSFSTLVRVGDASVVQEMMTAYYRGARDIISRRGAVLDKFIGDAALAIWGYPEQTGHDVSDAIRGAAELIALGRRVLEEFRARHNEVIESGTRVGIAHDEVLVLDIGAGEAEVSFVGNAINLAARLEGACAVDGILMDNRTAAALAESDTDLHRLADPREVVLNEQHVKGQLTDIRAWQIARDGVERILSQLR
jgi:class 3 adenylate cyclase